MGINELFCTCPLVLQLWLRIISSQIQFQCYIVGSNELLYVYLDDMFRY